MSQPIVDITHREEFSAAHRLHTEALSAEENLALYGPCNTVHGHNYAVEVTVRGPVDPMTGMVMNLTDLMRVMREEIWERADHQFLNEVPWMKGKVPTAENIAIACWGHVVARAADLGRGARVVRVRVEESRENVVVYHGPEGPRD